MDIELAERKPKQKGMGELEPPEQQVLIEFKNINYVVKKRAGPLCKRRTVERQILTNVNGIVAPGQLLILLGPSGAGKTTLLNVLAGRVTVGVTGEVLVNGQPRNKLFKRNTAFVLQEDIFFSQLTPKSTLTLTAQLVLPRHLSRSEKIAKAEELVDAFKIRKCADTRIGAPGIRGISGGEKKRLNVANELLAGSPLILLDEPTTGLDAGTALGVVQILSSLAKSGRTVIATLHSPSSQMFELFDKIIVLADGAIAYHGPARALVPYFSTIGYPCPEHYNPLDHVLELLDEHPEHEDPKAVRHDILDKYAPEKVEALTSGPEPYECPPPLVARSAGKYPATWLTQFHLLFVRGFKQHLVTVIPNAIIFTIIAVLSSIVWWNRGYTITDASDRAGLLFFILLHWYVFPLFGALNTFLPERLVFRKERTAAQYRVSAYFLARSLSQLPLDLITPILFCCVVYWCTNLNDSFSHFIVFICIIFVSFISGGSFGLVIASMVDHIEAASPLAMVTFFVSMLVSGFYVNSSDIPDWFGWLKYIAPLRYLFDAALVNEFKGETFHSNGQTLTGDSYIRSRGAIFPDEIWPSILVLLAMILVTQFLAYTLLYFKTKNRN